MPSSCEEVAELDPAAGNGGYVIELEGERLDVQCTEMGSAAPITWLELKGDNYAQRGFSGNQLMTST